MDTNGTHYIHYDPDTIWELIIGTYIAEGGDILYPGDEKEILLRAVQALLEAKRLSGRVLWLNPIPENKWKYVKSIQVMASICPMISCSTLRELAAACRRLAQA